MNNNILLALKGKDMVVVVGNDLSLVSFEQKELQDHKEILNQIESAREEDGRIQINIKDFLAYKLWNDYTQKKTPPKPYNLNNVVEILVKQGTTTEDDIKAYIIRSIKDLSPEQMVLDPFKKIAKIGNIETILSVNFDNFLERAFEAEGIKVNSSINFSIQDNDYFEGNINTDKALTKIFNLMGNISDSDFAITEEMQLEYLYRLLMGKNANIDALFNAVKDKSILFIGCSFPNWFMRFFIRTISKKRFKTGRSKFVASDRTAQDIDLSTFLEYNKTSVIPIGIAKTSESSEDVYKNSIEFIDKLFEVAQKNKGMVKENKKLYKEKLFLSYSWGDKNLIQKLKNEFEKCGVELFFDDDDLRNGENFSDSISEYINKCDYILPMISNNSISRKESYVYEKEWTQAIYVEKFKKSSGLFREGQETYIRPYIIDETSPTDDRIPEEIRKRKITSIPSEDNYGEMVRSFIKENQLTEIKN